MDTEAGEPTAMTTPSRAQQDGTCQYQKNIQDLRPDGEPQHTCQRKQMLGIWNSGVLAGLII